MKLYLPGDKSRAICESCQAMVTTTFGYHDVPFSDGNGSAKNILAAACDQCGSVVSVPGQSVPAIAKARDQADKPLEVSLRAPEVEILDAVAFRIDPHATSRFRKSVFTYYLGMLDQEPQMVERMKAGIEAWSKLSEKIRKQARVSNIKIPSRRLSIKISPRTEHKLDRVVAVSGLNRTDVMRGIVMMSKGDILDVADDVVTPVVRDLRVIADTVNG